MRALYKHISFMHEGYVCALSCYVCMHVMLAQYARIVIYHVMYQSIDHAMDHAIYHTTYNSIYHTRDHTVYLTIMHPIYRTTYTIPYTTHDDIPYTIPCTLRTIYPRIYNSRFSADRLGLRFGGIEAPPSSRLAPARIGLRLGGI